MYNRRYFFNGTFWFKKDDGQRIEKLSPEETEIMKKNTVEGQWVSVLGEEKFQERTDIRTWVTNEKRI